MDLFITNTQQIVFNAYSILVVMKSKCAVQMCVVVVN